VVVAVLRPAPPPREHVVAAAPIHTTPPPPPTRVVVVGCVGYDDDDDDDDWYGERILSHVPTTSTHGFNISGSAIVDAATWVVVLVVPDKVEE
jgi:hypothetical protein